MSAKSKHLRADGQLRGRSEACIAPVATLRPALADIPGAIRYLGDLSRAKFYADLLPQLDVVRFGRRTFVTIDSLDRLIAAKQQRAPRGTDAASSPNNIADRPELAAGERRRHHPTDTPLGGCR